MTKHTEGLLIASSIVGMPIVGQLGTVICNMATVPVAHPYHKEITEIAQVNAERLTACWNALAGIDDPAQFMADMKESMTTMENRGPKYIGELAMRIDGYFKGGAE